VAKYSSTGALTWIHTAGGNLGDYGHAISCDGTNYVYVAGEIEGVNNLITFPGSSITLTSVGDNDIFVAKYDLDGNLLWATSAGGYYNEKALGVTQDAAGNVYICGEYEDSCKFNASTMITGAGVLDIFVAKYDANGIFQWVRTAGSPGRDEAQAIKCDAAGNVYISGFYSNGMVAGSNTYSTSSGVYYDVFLAKYDTNGNLQWMQTEGGDYDDVGWSVTMDNNGLIYISGEFNAAAYFGSTQLITSGNADVFVACYNNAGVIQWAKRAGGPLNDRARGIGTDGTNLYITGQFGGTAMFDAASITSADSSDVFFASMTNSGSFTGAASIGGPADGPESLGYESGTAITAKDPNTIYSTGALLDGGMCGTFSLTPYTRTDVFVTKITSLVAGTREFKADPNDFYIYPNPGTGNFILYSGKTYPDVDITIYNCLGQTVTKRSNKSLSKLNIDLSNENNGVYFVEIKSENKTVATKKLVVNN
jgi:hypothetical protein